jgi:hypothetical protein
MLANQPLLRSWLLAPSEHDRESLLEYTRGVLQSLSFSQSGQAVQTRPVHTNSIRRAFHDLGVPALYRVGLKLLNLLGEIEPLSGGFWLLAPYRVIPIGSDWAFVGTVTSTSGRLGTVRQVGLARLIPSSVAVEFSTQSIESWMGSSEWTSRELVDLFVSAHQASAKPTISPPEIEFLSIQPMAKWGRVSTWLRKPTVILPQQRIAICRHVEHGIHRYFSAEVQGGKVRKEAPLVQSLARLIYSIADAGGTPVRATTKRSESAVEISVPERLPAEEYRVAVLLASGVKRFGPSSIYQVDVSVAPTLLKKLRDLGCQLEPHS